MRRAIQQPQRFAVTAKGRSISRLPFWAARRRVSVVIPTESSPTWMRHSGGYGRSADVVSFRTDRSINDSVSSPRRDGVRRSIASSDKSTGSIDSPADVVDDRKEWIPPDRPLGGDRGNAKEYQAFANPDNPSRGEDDTDDVEEYDPLKRSPEEVERMLQKESAVNKLLEQLDEQASRSRNDAFDDKLYRKYEVALREYEEEEKRQEEAALARLEADGGEELRMKEDELHESDTPASAADDADDEAVDWLQVRRKKMQEQDNSLQQELDIPVVAGQLLSADEIVHILTVIGATDINVILDNPEVPRMGGGIVEGMIICTASSSYQLITLSEAVAHQLELRNLKNLGVVGVPKKSRMSRASGRSKVRESWRLVNCGNYIVHVQDEVTRRSLRLDDLWSGKDPLWQLDWSDEDIVDEYVAKFPVPDEYGSSSVSLDTDSAGGESELYKYLRTTKHTRLGRPVTQPKNKKRKGRRRR